MRPAGTWSLRVPHDQISIVFADQKTRLPTTSTPPANQRQEWPSSATPLHLALNRRVADRIKNVYTQAIKKLTRPQGKHTMHRNLIPLLILVVSILPGAASADELTQIIQQDLVSLGYDPGNTHGEATTETIVAISTFQAEHDLEVTGAATPQLAGVIKAAIKQQGQPAAATSTQAAAAPDPAALQAAQQACLQQKMAAAQESQQKKRGFGRLARAVTRTASRFGGNSISRDVAEISGDVYTAGAVAEDLKGAAKDLGLTETDMEKCRNPF